MSQPSDLAHQSGDAAAIAKTLHHLRGLAGPVAADLFARLEEDLTAARIALENAARTQDIKEIRAQAHVLIALAGTAGAKGLHAAAVALNAMANAAPASAFTFAATLEPDLSHLVAAVRHQAAMGTDTQ